MFKFKLMNVNDGGVKCIEDFFYRFVCITFNDAECTYLVLYGTIITGDTLSAHKCRD